ncbi:MAG: response regulator, partial [Deltaproteobacteria bacterium]|nr:response regulator [Deltaproteobacteria bacterium]
MIEKEINILMVEEDPKEVDCLKEALAVGQFITVNLQQVEDGEQALAYLRHEHPYLEVPRPDLIFLDLNLPGMSGRELLEEMKQDELLTSCSVVVLTTSEAEQDIIQSYKLHANCYVTKPV